MYHLIKSATPTKVFVISAAIFGLFFLFATPPFQTPDEAVHFYRAYQISTGSLRIQHVGTINGGRLPASLEDTVNLTTQSHAIEFHPDVKYNLHATKAALSIPENSSQKNIYDLSATAYYPPTSYAPQAIGILTARILHLSPILMMYFGRIANLITWIVLLYFSIRLIPYKKWALAATGLLPMALFQATSLGVDVMTLGLTALVLSQVFRYRQQQNMSGKEYFLLLLSLVLLVLSKEIMFVFLPAVLLLPGSQKLGKLKPIIIKLSLVLFPLIVFGIWMAAVHNLSSPASPFGAQPHSQVHFILHDPLGYIKVLWSTYFFTPSDGIVRSFIGTFGWVDAPISEFFATVGYISLLFILLASSQAKVEQKLNHLEKLLLVGIGLVYWLAISTALYVYYDPLKYKTIIGLQGRYFIPIALLAIPLLRSSWLRVSERHYRSIAIALPIFLLFVSSVTLFYRYYVHV